VTSSSAPSPAPFVAVSRAGPPPPPGFVLKRGDFGAFRAMEPGSDDVLLLRPTADGLRIERPGIFETAAWDDVTGVVLTDVRVGACRVPAARILFRHGPSLDLADVLASGAEDLPMSLEAGGPPLLRVERLRMAVGSVVAASGLAPRSREHFHRGGRGVPVPDLVPRPKKMPKWVPPLLVVASVLFLVVVFPHLSFWSVIAIHLALLVHEVGHALAMRWTGTEVRSILFLPALGAATFAEHPFRRRWDDVVVALAGPVTGIPLAVTTLWLCDQKPPEPVRWGLVVAVAYNLLNLLPFAPMDGGRVLVALVAGWPRMVRTLAAWAPLAAAVGLVFLLGPGELSMGAALILAVAMITTRLALRRLDVHQWVLDIPLDPSALRGALRDLTWGYYGAARDDVDGGVPATPMSAAQSVVAVVLYAALFVCLAAATLALHPLVPEIAGGLPGNE
jgi:Zn-dependent protease